MISEHDLEKKGLKSWFRIMNKINIEKDFTEYKKLFLEENSKINLISKNEEKFLYEKHIYDSLGIKLFFEKYGIPKTVLDIGTGGGFPAVPIAIEYSQINVVGIDSIGKKIRAVSNIAKGLQLQNLELINNRVENIKDRSFDVVTSRAVGKTDLLIKYAYPILNKGGYIVLYKSKGAKEELDGAKNLIRKLQLKILPQIEYKLPTEEEYIRELIVLQK